MIEERSVSLDQILDTVELMMRVELNKETINNYAAALREGAVFPAVMLYDVDGELYLTDGFHRLAAHRRIKATEIRALVRPGTYDEALLAAVEAGAHGSLKRSNADKRKSVLALLRNERWRLMTDREIARKAGIAKSALVGSLRSVVTRSQQGEEKPRTGKDGKAYKARKPKHRVQPVRRSINDPPPRLPTFTPEQVGFPVNGTPEEQRAFTREHGHVQLMPLEEKIRRDRQLAARTFSGAVRTFGEAAKAFLRVEALSSPDYFAALAGLENDGALWLGKLASNLPALMTALALLEPFAAELARRVAVVEVEQPVAIEIEIDGND